MRKKLLTRSVPPLKKLLNLRQRMARTNSRQELMDLEVELSTLSTQLTRKRIDPPLQLEVKLLREHLFKKLVESMPA